MVISCPLSSVYVFQHSWLFVQSIAGCNVYFKLLCHILYLYCFKLVPITKNKWNTAHLILNNKQTVIMDSCKLSFSSKKHGRHRNKTLDTCSDIPNYTNNKTHMSPPPTYKNLPTVEVILTTTPPCPPVSLLKYCMAPLTYKTYLL